MLSLCAGISIFGLLAAGSANAELQQSQRSGAQLKASFQYLLSDFSGPVPSQWARLDFDPRQQEIYTFNPYLNEVRIFNRQGMSVFAFGEDGEIVAANDVAAGEDGDIYILARNFSRDGIRQLDYRGELERVISLQGLPEEFAGVGPDRLEYRDGRIYLLDTRKLRIVVTDADGLFQAGYDVGPELERKSEEQDPDKKKSLGIEISGFGVGSDGSIYFTVPTLFTAFRINPDGQIDSFGTSGSGPGKFGVVSGIAADPEGNIYVADRLRCVVMIFDPGFVFLGEFGYRGDRPEDMIVPDDVVIDPLDNRVFVAQAANKGVGVYTVSLNR